MNKIDLIINALDRVDTFNWNQQDKKLIKEALAAARELREMEPVDPNIFGEALAQPEHPLDKKADNARELGLDYEPDVYTNQQNVNTFEERVQKSEECVHEPVAYFYHDAPCAKLANPLAHSTLLVLACDRKPSYRNETPLYTAPPKREWLSLTDDEIYEVANGKGIRWGENYHANFARAIENKLKGKNGY
jgi:hypothetical protein